MAAAAYVLARSGKLKRPGPPDDELIGWIILLIVALLVIVGFNT